jgi:hypothetical protein
MPRPARPITGLMPQVSRPLLGVLLAAVLGLVVWTVALRPASTGVTNPAPAPTATVHGAVPAPGAARRPAGSAAGTAAPHASAANPAPAAPHGSAIRPAGSAAGTAAAHGSAIKPAPADSASVGHAVKAARTPVPQAGSHVVHRAATAPASQRVLDAIEHHQVVLVLFYNPSVVEDRALRDELNSLSVPAGVVKVAASIDDLAAYQVITEAVTINQSPTFVLVNRHSQLSTIEGYATSFELSTRVSQALAS